MRLTRLQPSIKTILVGAVLVAINLGAVVAALARYRDPAGTTRGEGTRTNFAQYSQYADGSLWKSRHDTASGETSRAMMIRPPTWPGLTVVWWPLAASLGVSLATAAIGLGRRRGRSRPLNRSHGTDTPI